MNITSHNSKAWDKQQSGDLQEWTLPVSPETIKLARENKARVLLTNEKLDLEIVQGDMKNLSRFEDNSFDLIFNPISNCFIEDPQPVWNECYRVLMPSGSLLSGFINPILYIFDFDDFDNGKLNITNTIPYSDLDQLPKDVLEERLKNNDTIEFGHSLESQIAGQIKAGFVINGFYEDISKHEVLDKHIKSSMATKAMKV